MNTKNFLIGFLTGMVLLVIMFYPLYVVLPAKYVDGWQGGSAGLSTALEIIAGLVVWFGGFIGGLVQRGGSKRRGVVSGAAVGGFAGFVLFCGLGAAAAGTEGTGVLLVQGLNPASGDTQFKALLVEALIRTIFWTYRTMWWMIMGGILLGAIGGLLAPSGAKEEKVEGYPKHQTIRKLALGIGSVVSSALVLIAVISIFSLLNMAVTNAATDVGVTTSLSPEGVLTYPATSALLIYLSFLTWFVWWIWKASQSEDPDQIATASIGAYIGGGIVFGTLILVYVINADFAVSRYYVAGGGLSFILGGVLLLSGFGLGRRAKNAARKVTPLSVWRRVLVIGYPIVGILFWLWMIDLIPFWINVIIGVLLLFGYMILLYYSIRKGREIEEQEVEIGFFNSEYWRENWFSLTTGGSLVIFFPVFAGSVQTALNLVIIVVQMIVPLANYGPNADPDLIIDATIADLIRQVFLTQASTALVGIFVAIVGVGLFSWFVGFVIQMVKESDTQDVGISNDGSTNQS